MKLLFTTLYIIAGTISKLSWIYPVVMFCLYLFKDKEFDWFSVWFMLYSWLVAVALFLITSFVFIKDGEREVKSRIGKKSGFQLRLEEMARKNGSK